MTREEIISGLQFTIYMLLFDPLTGGTFTEPSNDKVKTTIDVCKGAIELLEQGSTTKNDLGVDTDKLIADCEKMSFDFELFGRPTKALLLDAVKNIVKDLPPITPIRPKGHWIGHREHCENLGVMPSGLGAYEWCSNCDCGIDVREWHRNYYNYCPNCGAKMI